MQQKTEHLTKFQSYYSLISNLFDWLSQIISQINFNPIIVLFLTKEKIPFLPKKDFNPIIVLFLTILQAVIGKPVLIFQSYYSLISNCFYTVPIFSYIGFQSYYSLISNYKYNQEPDTYQDFNPIIVLFLTGFTFNTFTISLFQSYYSLISNNLLNYSRDRILIFQSYYSLISNAFLNKS